MVYVRFQDFVGSITVEYPVPQDIMDDVLPDPDDLLADIELLDQQALIDALLDGLCKESFKRDNVSNNAVRRAGVLRHNCLIWTLYFHFETPRKFGRRSLKYAGGFSTGMEHSAIATT